MSDEELEVWHARNIYQRILGVMADIDYVQKGEKTVANQYRFVSHDSVTAIIHPQLVKHGIVCVPSVKSLVQDGNRTTVCLYVMFVNSDEPGDFVSLESWGYGVDSSDKGPGKAVSYAFKYAFLKLFVLETGDDPDNDQDSKYEPPEAKETISPVMTATQFLEALDDVMGFRLNFSAEQMGTYLESISKKPGKEPVAIPRIMEQALHSLERAKRFCNSHQAWLDAVK